MGDDVNELVGVTRDLEIETPTPRPRIDATSRKVAKDCLNQIRCLLGVRFANPVVGPAPDRGVALIWRKAQGSEIHLLCSPNGARYLALAPNRQVVDQSGSFMDCSDFALQVLKRLDL